MNLADLFLKKNAPEDAKSQFNAWQTNTKIIFLNTLVDRINEVTDEVYNNLRDALGLFNLQNSEILNLWYLIGLTTKQNDIIPYTEDFLSKNGRMKFIRPLYHAFYLFNKEEALKTFNRYKVIYHPVAVKLIEQDFKSLENTVPII